MPVVRPAPAGMSPAWSDSPRTFSGPPRASGDEPLRQNRAALGGRSAPRQRG